ncbi:MAG: response regulator [Proteobacteria bacterium]|nr:response regulator [Pseudomonadota bacterium]
MDDKHVVLIVDDIPENLRVLGDMIEQEGYEVLVATNGQDALDDVARATPLPDLILLDIMMPGMDGYEVCRRLKADPEFMKIPVIFISALGMAEQKIQGFHAGAVDYITKPFQVEEVVARVNTHIELKLCRDDLQSLVKKQTHKYLLAKEATIASMATIAEFRDPETGGHIQRTKHYVRLLAENLNPLLPDPMSPDKIELLFQSVPLHDIGKVGVHDAILYKQGKLTEMEFEEMKKHCQYGSEAIMRTEAILGSSSFMQYARELAEFHHEKWDGSGYPHGLKGDEIPLSARMMMLADIYDALISRRSYKEPLSHEAAFKIITEGDGRTMPEHFAPDVLKIFLAVHLEFARIAKMFE